MNSIVLFSCNHQVKYDIQQQYADERHYVWCSPFYDKTMESGISSRVGASSDPHQIMRHMMTAIFPDPDDHLGVIADRRETLRDLAADWWADGRIDELEAEEIYRVTEGLNVEAWRPLLYVIPVTDSIRARLVTVPPAERSSFGGEYKIEDLHRSEFSVIRPDLIRAYG